jgi:hypothetical protein
LHVDNYLSEKNALQPHVILLLPTNRWMKNGLQTKKKEATSENDAGITSVTGHALAGKSLLQKK